MKLILEKYGEKKQGKYKIILKMKIKFQETKKEGKYSKKFYYLFLHDNAS